MKVPELGARATGIARIVMLAVIALVALANGLGWVEADADLWIPFVCVIAVMGVGTRGGPVDSLQFVLIEASVVALLGVATFSSWRDGVWVASVAVSVIAVGKIAMVEMHRHDASAAEAKQRAGSPPPDASRPREVSDTDRLLAALAESSSIAAASEKTGLRPVARPRPAPTADEAPAVEAPPAPAARAPSEAPPAPIASPSPVSAPRAPVEPAPVERAPRKRRERDDPTPKSVPNDRSR